MLGQFSAMRKQCIPVCPHQLFLHRYEGYAVHRIELMNATIHIRKGLLFSKLLEMNGVVLGDRLGFRPPEIPDQFYFSVQVAVV